MLSSRPDPKAFESLIAEYRDKSNEVFSECVVRLASEIRLVGIESGRGENDNGEISDDFGDNDIPNGGDPVALGAGDPGENTNPNANPNANPNPNPNPNRNPDPDPKPNDLKPT